MKLHDPGWYFDGYCAEVTVKPNGRKVKDYYYTGTYWAPDLSAQSVQRRKLVYVIAVALYAILWLLLNLMPASGGLVVWVGGISFCVIAPLMFLCLGTIRFVTSCIPWTKREYWVGWRRMCLAAIPAAVLSDLASIGEVIYMILQKKLEIGEIIYVAGLVLCGGIITCMATDLLRHKARMTNENKSDNTKTAN